MSQAHSGGEGAGDAAMARAGSHLDTLGVVHYVIGALIALGSCIPVVQLTIGVVIIVGGFGLESLQDVLRIPRWFGAVFVVAGAVAGVAINIIGWSMIWSGRQMRRRRRHSTSFVIACVMCTVFPLGTILGVITIVTLQRPAVRALYDGTEPRA